MREPRPENFDPKVRKPKPEAVNMTGVVPLLPASPHESPNVIDTNNVQPQIAEQASESVPSTSVRNSERTEFRSEIRTEQRTEWLPFKRRTKRYSFEFFEDQLVKLKQLKRQAEDRGENITLSDIARAALDVYLQGK